MITCWPSDEPSSDEEPYAITLNATLHLYNYTPIEQSGMPEPHENHLPAVMVNTGSYSQNTWRTLPHSRTQAITDYDTWWHLIGLGSLTYATCHNAIGSLDRNGSWHHHFWHGCHVSPIDWFTHFSMASRPAEVSPYPLLLTRPAMIWLPTDRNPGTQKWKALRPYDQIDFSILRALHSYNPYSLTDQL
jgi:hypothetical protein